MAKDKLTKAANVVWGVIAYGLGYGLGAVAWLLLAGAEPLINAGHAAKRRAMLAAAGGKTG